MTYTYPLPRDEWTDGRVDQGVDFVNKSASSRILAIGKAKILSTGAPGWPAEGGVLYELLDGPARGKVVYVYENVLPHVSPGQIVAGGQVIATMKGTGYPWLEMGWANRAGEPISHGEYTEGKETVAGKQFRRFLSALKASPSSGSGFSSFGPLGTAEEIITAPSRAIAGVIEGAPEAASGVAGQVLSGLESALGEKAVPIALNIALVGGGAFLFYFGVARMVGVNHPVATPLGAVKRAGETAAVAGAAA